MIDISIVPFLWNKESRYKILIRKPVYEELEIIKQHFTSGSPLGEILSLYIDINNIINYISLLACRMREMSVGDEYYFYHCEEFSAMFKPEILSYLWGDFYTEDIPETDGAKIIYFYEQI